MKTTRGAAVEAKVTLEDYSSFLRCPDHRSFTLQQLNQIVLMHGFLKLKTKVAIMEGLRTVDMMRPVRLTLQDRATYPCAALSLDEVNADVATLGWQECPLGSVVTVGRTALEDVRPVSAASTPLVGLGLLSSAAAPASATATVEEKKRKRSGATPPIDFT